MDNYNNTNRPPQPSYNSNTYSTYNQNTYSNYNNSYRNNGYRNNGYNRNPRHNYDDDSYSGKSNKNKPSSLIIMGLMFILAGLFISIIQCNERMKYHDIADEGNSTYAYVTDVDRRTTTTRRRTSSGRKRKTTKTRYYVSATYAVDNHSYPINFESGSSYTKGESFKIYYQKSDPSNYVIEGDDGGLIIFGIMPIVFGAVIGVVGIKKYRDERDLKAMGLL